MNRCRQSGFTLLEMIVVLVILGLALSLVITQGPMHSAHLDAEVIARNLTSTLRMARGMAIAENRPVAVVLSATSYGIAGWLRMAFRRT